MHQIQLSDDVFQTAQQRALEFGYANVDEYVAAMVREDSQTPNLEHLFTPERLAKIDRSSAQVKAGQVKTEAQVDEYLKKVRQDLIEKSK